MRRKKPEIFALAVEEAKKPGGLKVSQLVKKVGLSRQQIVRYLTELCEASILKREGKGPAVVYRFYDQIQPIVTVEMQTSDLGALSEDQFYQNLVRPHLDHLPKSTLSILNHGTTEMLNNIIDHSQSAQMTFSMSEDAKDIYVELTDDGIGIFEKNREAFGAKNLYEAVAETAKGRQTSAPEAHAGEGIFYFTNI